ncbi:hypothetical protein LTR56_001976 [Elasticomyces elasticus]|nr:hypothetical protein LTR22_011561 [Elasticomyces elasticus]KAK3658120.1 hypothetical protein LTR56_001976 [Elasticomyces elasticus]KAK4914894.1 hypothetical protein LTR49_016883 [Elasticomyces elasticus]KAK5749130.1 hypothetical protein LTS12_020825 [Elasticomyces elasticus]
MYLNIATIVAVATILTTVNATAAEDREGRNSLLNMTGNKTSCYDACQPALDALLFGEQNIDDRESHRLAATSCVTNCEDEKYNNQVAKLRKRLAEVEKVLRLADDMSHKIAGDTWTEDGWMIKSQRDETGTKSLAYY